MLKPSGMITVVSSIFVLPGIRPISQFVASAQSVEVVPVQVAVIAPSFQPFLKTVAIFALVALFDISKAPAVITSAVSVIFMLLSIERYSPVKFAFCMTN